MSNDLLNARLLTRIGDKKARLQALRPLPAAALRRLEEQLAIEWTYNSNAIEGSTLTLRETQLILEQGITIGGKSLREHFEAVNHRDAILLVQDLAARAEPITPAVVRQLHALVLARIDDENAGQYRQLPVRIAGSAHEPPPAWDVAARMTDWAGWLAGQEAAGVERVELAAVAHHRLVSIHPFLDGNARTARLIMNLVLLRGDYPPAIIARANRAQYYRALSQADRGVEAPLANLVGRAVERSLTLYLEAVTPQTAPPHDEAWLPLREAAEGTPYSQEYLSLLARTGRLEAIKRGRNWYTTRAALRRYQRSLAKQQENQTG